ncbi:hypothetical protein [Actinomadura rudentiformis]|uniref:Uncharacterized protein n=1 Tax=Actinomadura rudentiformis TaxID=359158 RepID=A0A6H9YJ53_9ACTN|nr:hypothetical protein [Actinomadura rudentiformis]KAB2341287.1 hypothetical protein F8566_41950 [Actinomadura rudentiformis]
MRQIDIGLDSLQKKQAPMCSLSGTRLPGRYGAAVRQFSNTISGKGEIKYAQLIARYTDAQGAATAYEVLRKAARSCPPKRHVPPKRLNENFTLFEHDDTWKVTEGNLAGWAHLRGFEQHVEPPSQTKFNVYYFIYDYAHRGNVVTATLYWERTEPKKSGDPIAQRATELLTRQLQKIG